MSNHYLTTATIYERQNDIYNAILLVTQSRRAKSTLSKCELLAVLVYLRQDVYIWIRSTTTTGFIFESPLDGVQ